MATYQEALDHMDSQPGGKHAKCDETGEILFYRDSAKKLRFVNGSEYRNEDSIIKKDNSVDIPQSMKDDNWDLIG